MNFQPLDLFPDCMENPTTHTSYLKEKLLLLLVIWLKLVFFVAAGFVVTLTHDSTNLSIVPSVLFFFPVTGIRCLDSQFASLN